MQSLAGVSGAGPLFRRVLDSLPPTPPSFTPTHGPTNLVVTAPICALSGMRSGPSCGHVRHGAIRPDSLRKLEMCDWHSKIRIDKRNNLLAGPTCSDEHVTEKIISALPADYAQWQAARLHHAPPSEYSPHCPGPNNEHAHAEVTFPRRNERFAIDPGYSPQNQRIRMTVQIAKPVKEVVWFINGKEIGKANWPYAITWQLSPGEHKVQVASSGHKSPEVSFLVL